MKKLKYLLFFTFLFMFTPKVFAWENIGYNVVDMGYSQVNVSSETPLVSQNTTNYSLNLDSTFTLTRPVNDVSGVISSFARDFYFILGTQQNVVAGHTYILTFAIRRSNQYVQRDLFYPYVHDDDVSYLYIGTGTENVMQRDYSYSWKYDQLLQESLGYLDAISISVKANTNGTGFILRLGNRLVDNHFMYVNNWQGHDSQLQIWTASIVDVGTDYTDEQIGNISNQLNDINNSLTNVNNNLSELNDNLSGVNDELKDINDNLTDETLPDEDLFDIDTGSNTPISDLLTLPLTLLNAYLVGFNGTCQRYSFGTLYGTELYLPCIDLESILGSTIWGIIDSLCSLFLIYEIAMLCVYIFESITSLEDPMLSLYSPKHVYKPKHGGVD